MFEHNHPVPVHGGAPAPATPTTPGDLTPPSRVPTPLRQTPKRLRPYVYALMAFKHGRDFQAKPSKHHTRRLSLIAAKEGPFAPTLTVSKINSVDINDF
jgi:hypothetical protein